VNRKKNLVSRCLNALTETGITVVSLTFDGCAVNVSMAKVLGCKLASTPQLIKTDFNAFNDFNVNIIFDPTHMVKLVRNTFGEKRQLIDCHNGIIDFNYIELLLMLQENDKWHLANKLKKQHVFYFKNKMKMKLATQLLSSSIAQALTFCKGFLKLDDKDCTATINFIQIFNDAFDILNSRTQSTYGFKGAVNDTNYSYIFSFIQKFYLYINKLKLITEQPILESQRSTGFLGFLISFNSLINLKKSLIDTDKLKYLPFYKLSQDHLEIFYGSVRAQEGNNNNPTARQFKFAYKKLLMNAQIKDSGLGNSIFLQDIPILNCSSVSSNPVQAIHSSNTTLYKDIELESELYTVEKDATHIN